jgi:hypothetical protein
MSQVLTAFIEKTRVPARTEFEEAVRVLGFDCSIDAFYQPFACSGFLPCVLNGRETGFEIDFDGAAETTARLPDLKAQIGNRDSAISFRWGGDSTECACVLIFAAALAKARGAVVYYQDGGLFYTAERLIDDGKKMLAEPK